MAPPDFRGQFVGEAVQLRAPAVFRFVKKWVSVSEMAVARRPWFRWLNQIPIRSSRKLLWSPRLSPFHNSSAGNAEKRFRITGLIRRAIFSSGVTPETGGSRDVSISRGTKWELMWLIWITVSGSASELKVVLDPSSLINAVPALPGAQNTRSTRGDWANRCAMVCSRPPLPMTMTRMPTSFKRARWGIPFVAHSLLTDHDITVHDWAPPIRSATAFS